MERRDGRTPYCFFFRWEASKVGRGIFIDVTVSIVSALERLIVAVV